MAEPYPETRLWDLAAKGTEQGLSAAEREEFRRLYAGYAERTMAQTRATLERFQEAVTALQVETPTQTIAYTMEPAGEDDTTPRLRY
jgi:hypothetical protein